MSAATARAPQSRNPALSWLLLALLASLVFHLGIVLWSRGLLLDFGPPLVDPIEPARFNLERATIDPRRLEPEIPQPTALTTQRPSGPASLAPGEIEAFSGPLQAPRIPLPSLTGEPSMPLSAGLAVTPVDALTALPAAPEGKIPSVSQALVEDATTAALAETTKVLSTSGLSGGPDAANSGARLPSAADISELVNLRPPGAVARPGIQPILIRLSNDVLFSFDSAVLLPSASGTVQRLADALRGAVKMKITVEGHTDSIGDEAYNLKLSEQRARSVADALIARGVPAAGLATKGFGKSRPIVPQSGDAEKEKLNRRVEIRIEAER
ncbi:MAG: OmpA family protein [Candidatus Methylacidiphilales bacterium]|nr:OmpA family protein [Candidatus Methylacidiphilales bacterium]